MGYVLFQYHFSRLSVHRAPKFKQSNQVLLLPLNTVVSCIRQMFNVLTLLCLLTLLPPCTTPTCCTPPFRDNLTLATLHYSIKHPIPLRQP